MNMAAAHIPPLPVHEEESEMSAHINAAAPTPVSPATETDQRTISPVLIVMLAALAIYPFVVGFLPEPVRQYLGSLFR